MAVKSRQAAPNTTRLLRSRTLLLPGLAMVTLLLVACLLWSITLGAADITPEVVFTALFNYDETEFDHLIIQTVRLPRVLAGVLVGAGLAVAGAIMQGLTRNPLADSGILGINAGAAFAVVMTVYLLGSPSLSIYAVAALVGAAAAAVIVYGLGAMERDILLREGWVWTTYQRQGIELAKDEDDPPGWAEIRITYQSWDGSVRGAYEGRVTIAARVETIGSTGDEKTHAYPQYQVTRLEKVE